MDPRAMRESQLLSAWGGPKEQAPDAGFEMAAMDEGGLAYAHDGMLCVLLDAAASNWRQPFQLFPQLSRLMESNSMAASLPLLDDGVELPGRTSVIMAGLPAKRKFGAQETDYKSVNATANQAEELRCNGILNPVHVLVFATPVSVPL